MPYVVTYKLDDEEFLKLKADLSGRLADLRPVLKQAGEYMLLEVDDRFKQERGTDGSPWTPNAAATLVRAFEKRGKRKAFTKRGKETKGFQGFRVGKKILQEKGSRGGLRSSITYRAGRATLEHGTNVIYGAIQQLGGQAGRGKKVTIPARPYLGYSEANLTHIRNLVRAFIGEAKSR